MEKVWNVRPKSPFIEMDNPPHCHGRPTIPYQDRDHSLVDTSEVRLYSLLQSQLPMSLGVVVCDTYRCHLYSQQSQKQSLLTIHGGLEKEKGGPFNTYTPKEKIRTVTKTE